MHSSYVSNLDMLDIYPAKFAALLCMKCLRKSQIKMYIVIVIVAVIVIVIIVIVKLLLCGYSCCCCYSVLCYVASNSNDWLDFDS